MVDRYFVTSQCMNQIKKKPTYALHPCMNVTLYRGIAACVGGLGVVKKNCMHDMIQSIYTRITGER